MASPSATPRSRLIRDSQREFTLYSAIPQTKPTIVRKMSFLMPNIASPITPFCRITASDTANSPNNPARAILRGRAMAARNRMLTTN